MQRIASALSSSDDNPLHATSALELDSHADSPVVGKHCLLLKRTGRQVNVSGFTHQLGAPIKVDVVDAVVAYDCEYTGKTLMLMLRNALYFPKMDISLIPPFMMRLAGVDLNECPKFLAKSPSIEHHSLYFPDFDIRIPLHLHGVISYLQVRSPSQVEFTTCPEPVLELTPQLQQWDPHNDQFEQQESSMLNFRGELKEAGPRQFIISSIIQRSLDPTAFCYDLTSRACESGSSCHNVYSLKTANGSTSTFNPSHLADIWGIGLETARRTIKVTTRLCPRNTTDISLNRRYEANDRVSRYKHLDLTLFMDTMFASKRVGKSHRDYTCVQVYATEFGWVKADPMKSEKDIHLSLKSLFKETGVTTKLVVDGARAQVQGKARDLCHKASCNVIELEKDTPASNRAERFIQILKNGSKKDMASSDSPLVFWCYCIERRAMIENACAKDNFLLKGNSPHSMMTGEVTDISNLCNFKWYEWVKFRKPGEPYPYPTEHLGRCLGPAVNKGNAMSQNVVTESGKIIPTQTLRSLTDSEVRSSTEIERRSKMDKFIRSRYGDSTSVPDNWIKRRRKPGDPEQNDDPNEANANEELKPTSDFYEDEVSNNKSEMPDADNIPDLDQYLHAEVLLPKDGKHMQAAQVIGRSTDDNGIPIGEYDANPILNSRVYDVMFPDGSVQQYAANIIAENVYSQVDEEGHRYIMLDEIVDHRKNDDAVEKHDGFVVNSKGRKSRKYTTKGWDFLITWKDGTQSWGKSRILLKCQSMPILVELFMSPHSHGGFHLH